jgi:hypothetical protein
LSQALLQGFLEKGYVVVRSCFSRETAKEWTDLAYKRLGYDPHNPETWKEDYVMLPWTRNVEVSEFAPKAWAAICDLVGGQSRILGEANHTWPDAFIANFSRSEGRSWRPPSPTEDTGWHKDGDEFTHYLDSAEMGLLAFVLWTETEPHGGGAFIACDSIAPVARFLLARPQGCTSAEIKASRMIEKCKDIVELTGDPGDVYLLHPYMLHIGSANASGKPRFMTNTFVPLKEPLNFDRRPRSGLSPVELATLRALGTPSLNFKRKAR